jgi:hypothetical protein
MGCNHHCRDENVQPANSCRCQTAGIIIANHLARCRILSNSCRASRRKMSLDTSHLLRVLIGWRASHRVFVLASLQFGPRLNLVASALNGRA